MASAMDRRFEIAEQQLRRKELQREQQEKEGLRRKFVSIGGLGSGASFKAEQAAGEAASRRLSEGKQQIEVAKLGEQARQEEIAGQRAFQTSERLGGQEFAAGEGEKGRKFATGERLGSQEFATGERLSSQDFTARENDLTRTSTKELAVMANDIAQQGIDISAEELEISKIVSAFNMGNKTLFDQWITSMIGGSAPVTPAASSPLGSTAGIPNNLANFDDSDPYTAKQKSAAIGEYNKLIGEGMSPNMIEIKFIPTGTGGHRITVGKRDVVPGSEGTAFGGLTDPKGDKPPVIKPLDFSGLPQFGNFNFSIS